MSNYHHSCSVVGERNKASTLLQTFLAIPPNFFSITMGLVGLAGVWQLTGKFHKWPAPISGTLYLVATTVYLLLLIASGSKLLFSWKTLVADLTHPVLGPFNSLLPITGMLLALGLEPYSHQAALGLFLMFLVATLLLGSWMLSRWFVDRRDLDLLHSGYYLPTVAGGLIGSEGLARFGFAGAGWICFGIGLITWLLLGSIIFNRLFTRPGLPKGLMPTMAIEIAPSALAGNAYLTLTGGNFNLLSYMFVGYTLLMILVQLCLLPSYRKLPFVVGFWSFTFPSAAAAAYIIRWVHLAQPTGTALLDLALLTIVTLLIGGLALRSLVALRRGKFLPSLATA
jgi:tellurite resistance protein